MSTSRRAFLAGAGASLLAAPAVVRAQERPTLHLAIITGAYGVDDMTETGAPPVALVLAELRRLGYVEGLNLIVERWSNVGRPDSELPELAKKVVASRPQIIYALASLATVATKNATSTIPIVFAAADPMGWGIVDNLRRPGGNVTGFATDAGPELYQKQLQILVEIAGTKSVTYLYTSATTASPLRKAVLSGAEALGIDLRSAVAQGAVDESSIRRALADSAPQDGRALYVHNAAILTALAGYISSEALRLRLPAMGNRRVFPDSGLLMSYGIQESETYLGAAGYIIRIAKGDTPAELPVQLPRRYEFIVNLRTARALGIEVPLPLTGLVSEWIE